MQIPRSLNRLLFIFCFTLSHGIIFSQKISGLKHFGSGEGLSEGTISCITQDKQGFLWVGTISGLNRFDGYSFRTFENNPHDTSSPKSNSIRSLIVDSAGKVWIGTAKGIDIYNPRTDKISSFSLWHPKSKSDKIVVSQMQFIPNGLLLVGTNVGFATIDTASGAYTPYSGMKEGAADSMKFSVTTIFCDAQKKFWFGTDQGLLLKWNGGKEEPEIKQKIFCQKENDGVTINGIEEYNDEIIILATSCGVKFYDKKTGKALNYFQDHSFSDTLCQCNFNKILKVNEYEFYVIDGHRLIDLNFKNNALKTIINNESGDENCFTTAQQLFIDRQGILWVGDYGRGLYEYYPDATRFGLITADIAEPNHVVNPYVFDFAEKGDSLFVGSNWGIDIFNAKTGTVSLINLSGEKKAENFPLAIQYIGLGDSNDIWFTTRWSYTGLVHLNYLTGEKRIYSKDDGMISARPGEILKMKNGNFWIATRDKGILIFNPANGKFSQMETDSTNSNSISSNRINDLVADEKGNIFISSNKGLDVLNEQTGKMQHFQVDARDTNSISSNMVFGVTIDLKGNVWVSTEFGFGELNLSTGKFKNYSAKNGLPNNIVNGILPDSSGYLWISTNKGIAKFNPGDGTFKNYGVDDGLQSMEFNVGSMLYGKSGRMYFGGVNGFNYFNPKEVRENKYAPPVYITGISVYDHPFATDTNIILKKNIELDYTQNFLSFDFVALNFYMSAKNKFACMLEGVDKNWIYIGDKRTISYSNLAPGEYVLHVKASNNDGLWNETGTALHIIIYPPFWRTKWFYTLCGLILIFSGWGFVRWRERKLREEKNILENKVEERTTELRQEKEKVSAAHKDISDSINYARRIQSTILPGEEEWNKLLPDSFVYYHPRDVVSGDFFWITHSGNKTLVAAADCTGHGVPGAFMSMIGHTQLNDIVTQEKIQEPNAILNRLHVKVSAALKQDAGSETRDGMDIALISIDREKNELLYAGANRPILIVHDGVAEEIKANKFPIGGGSDSGERNFSGTSVELKKGSTVYLFSDGFADQFGGPKGKKFGTKQLRELLLSISSMSMQEQKTALEKSFNEWKGNLEQVDDILLIGVRI